MFGFVTLAKMLVLLMKSKKLYIWLQAALILPMVVLFCMVLIKAITPFNTYTNRYLSHLGPVADILLILTNATGLISIAKSRELIRYLLPPRLGLDSGRPNLIWLSFVGCHILTLIAFPMEVYFMAYVHLNGYYYQLYKLSGSLNRLICHIILVVVLVLANVINHNLHELNKSLKRPKECYVSCIQVPNVPGDGLPNIRYEIAGLRRLEFLERMTRKFQEVYDQLDRFNEQFQKYFVMLMMYLVVIQLMCCSGLVLIYLNAEMVSDNFPQIPSNFWILIMAIFYILCGLGNLMLAVLTSEQLQNEGENTSRICYSLLNELPAGPSFTYYQLIREQINLLLNQNKSSKVYLHTGGFFRMNWAILGTIASIVVTYAIIIIQLDSKFSYAN